MIINPGRAKANLCRRSYKDFLRTFWPVVNPGEPLEWNWHLDLMCDQVQNKYERLFAGEKRDGDTVTNVSPGTSKSTVYSIMTTPWAWSRMPYFHQIGASYSYPVALDLSRKARDVVKSDLYRSLFPEIVLRDDMDTKGHFGNTMGGVRYAVGSRGSVTGMHGHVITIDDPLNPEQSTSDVEMEMVIDWIQRTLLNRWKNKRTGFAQLVMQRLACGDPTDVMLSRKGIQWLCLPATLEFPVHPPDLAAYYRDGLMDPSRLTRDYLDGERKVGDYYYCTPGYTPILMSDWTEKKIEDVKVGDEVVGYDVGPGTKSKTRKRSGIIKSQVVAKQSWNRRVVKMTMASGRTVYCTPDHKWWTRMHDRGMRRAYQPARVGSHLYSVYDPLVPPTPNQQRAYDWLGGMIDGDGYAQTTGLNVGIAQSPSANPEVFRRIEWVLRYLGFSYTKYDFERKDPGYFGARLVDRGRSGGFVVGGRRSAKMRLLSNCRMVKRDAVLQTIWNGPGYVAEKKDRIVKIEDAGVQTVYGLTTTSGNYVAWGYASQNSGQYGQSPIPLGGGHFRTDLIRAGRQPAEFKRLVRFWDRAATPEAPGRNNRRAAYTVGVLMGIDLEDRIWVLDVARFRLDSFSREQQIKRTTLRDGRAVAIGIEQEPGSGGLDSVRATARMLAGYNVKILRAAGSKETRADAFSVAVNGGNVYIPDRMRDGTEWAGWAKDYINELKYWPFSTYKDQGDASGGGYSLLTEGMVRIGPLPNPRRRAMIGRLTGTEPRAGGRAGVGAILRTRRGVRTVSWARPPA